MLKHPLDFNTRKALCVQLGDEVGRELADLVFRLAARIEALERGKVDVTPIVIAGQSAAEGSPNLSEF